MASVNQLFLRINVNPSVSNVTWFQDERPAYGERSSDHSDDNTVLRFRSGRQSAIVEYGRGQKPKNERYFYTKRSRQRTFWSFRNREQTLKFEIVCENSSTKKKLDCQCGWKRKGRCLNVINQKARFEVIHFEIGWKAGRRRWVDPFRYWVSAVRMIKRKECEICLERSHGTTEFVLVDRELVSWIDRPGPKTTIRNDTKVAECQLLTNHN